MECRAFKFTQDQLYMLLLAECIDSIDDNVLILTRAELDDFGVKVDEYAIKLCVDG